MTFLNPLVLFGLIAAAIPLLIHLFNFRRPQKVDFSSLVFLRELQETTMRRVKIKQWLLLLLRTLAIGALVLSFARPTLKGSIASVLGGDAETASVLIVDNSLSMTVRDIDGVLLDQARRVALEFAGLMRDGDQVAVLRTGDRRPSEPRWHRTRPALADEIDSIEPSTAFSDLAEAVAKAGDWLLSTTFVNREIFVLSDLQATAIGDSLTREFPTEIPVRLVKLGTQSIPNTAVTDVRLMSQIIEVGRPVQVDATLASYGSEGPTSILASVFLDGERSAQAEVVVDANSTVNVELVVTPRRTGWLDGTVELEDDNLADDNRRYFALAAPEARRVLLASGSGFDATYLNLALASDVTPGRARYDVDAASESALSSRRLADYDAVILAGVASLSSGQISSLTTYVSTGGGLLMYPPTSADASSINAVLSRLGGGSIEGFVGPTADPVVAADADTEHPLFEGVFDTGESGSGPNLEKFDVYRFAAYRSANAAENTLVRLSTGHPFLQEIPSGRGKVLLMASVPTPSWTELPLRGLFVPLLHRAISYVSASESPGGERLTIGDRLDMQLAGFSESDVIEILGGEEQLVPAQRPAFGGMVVTVGDGISRPGVYAVKVGDRVVGKLSANLDARESDVRTLDTDSAVEQLRASTDVDLRAMAVDGEVGFAAAISTMRTGIELWNVFLGVALVILLAEMLVARLWRPESAAT